MVETTAPRKPLLPPRLVKPLAIAFGVGLLLFLLLWLDQRKDNDFFRSGGTDPAEGSTDTLPAPLPADVASEDGNASGLRLPQARQSTPAPPTGQARIIGEPAPPPPAPVAPAAPLPQVASARGNDIPVPISQPAPRYPREALRRNDGGTVRVRVTVTADGSVDRLELAEGSGNRYLDRAAMEAVRRWRFRPAVRDGQPVAADVVVPIVFNPGG